LLQAPLSPFFNPRTVAVIGAAHGSERHLCASQRALRDSKKLKGEVLSNNYSTRDMSTRLGFHFEEPDSGTVAAWLELLETP
jgi:hypothetical protein